MSLFGEAPGSAGRGTLPAPSHRPIPTDSGARPEHNDQVSGQGTSGAQSTKKGRGWRESGQTGLRSPVGNLQGPMRPSRAVALLRVTLLRKLVMTKHPGGGGGPLARL